MKEGDEKPCCKSYIPAEAIMASEVPTAMKFDVSHLIVTVTPGDYDLHSVIGSTRRTMAI